MYVCVCVCVCVCNKNNTKRETKEILKKKYVREILTQERERERERENVCVYVCVCVWRVEIWTKKKVLLVYNLEEILKSV